MKEKFENNWTSTVEALRSNVEQKQELIDKVIGENRELLEACVFTRKVLGDLTTDEFSKGGDKPARNKLDIAIANAGGER